jgi:hypothetical protein
MADFKPNFMTTTATGISGTLRAKMPDYTNRVVAVTLDFAPSL